MYRRTLNETHVPTTTTLGFQGEALNRALLIKFLVQATLYLNCCFGSPEKGLLVLFMFDTALFSAMASRGDNRPRAAAERAAGAVHLYLI
jgi:hypothetical protein